jgi:ArsR family transcriptional regulator
VTGPEPLEATAERLRALANPARLRIAFRLLDGECAVGTLEAELGLRQPALSQQLAVLREAGLLTARRASKAVIYSLSEPDGAMLMRGIAAGLGLAAPDMPAVRPIRRAPISLMGAMFATVGDPS